MLSFTDSPAETVSDPNMSPKSTVNELPSLEADDDALSCFSCFCSGAGASAVAAGFSSTAGAAGPGAGAGSSALGSATAAEVSEAEFLSSFSEVSGEAAGSFFCSAAGSVSAVPAASLFTRCPAGAFQRALSVLSSTASITKLSERSARALLSFVTWTLTVWLPAFLMACEMLLSEPERSPSIFQA